MGGGKRERSHGRKVRGGLGPSNPGRACPLTWAAGEGPDEGPSLFLQLALISNLLSVVRPGQDGGCRGTS